MQILYLLYYRNKSLKNLQQFNDVITIMEENMIVIRNIKTFCFNFDLSKDFDENWNCKIEFNRKRNESLAEIIIKNKIKELLLRLKQ